MKSSFVKAMLLLILSFATWQVAVAGITGKISGQVTDSQTGEPLVGVNVTLPEYRLGAATDLEGWYTIINVPPGIYVVRFSTIGYISLELTDAQVNIDLTTSLDAGLESTILEAAETVVIKAERKQIQVDQTYSASYIDAERIRALPVKEISQIVQLQAGVVDGHFRGGRSGEVAYLVDGIPMNDVYDGSAGTSVDVASVQELQVISGTFNAEFGQAMSGVVNTVTRDGGGDYHGRAAAYCGEYISGHTDIFMNIDRVDPFNLMEGQLSLSGPVPLVSQLSFYGNLRASRNLGWLEGIRRYNTDEPHFIVTAIEPWMLDEEGNLPPHQVIAQNTIFFFQQENDSTWLVLDTPSGDGNRVQMNTEERLSGQFKLTLPLSPTAKLRFNNFFTRREYQDYDHAWVYSPDGRLNRFSTSYTNTIKFDHTLSGRTFYVLSLTRTFNKYHHYLFEDLLDSRLVNPGIMDQHGTLFYLMGGTQNQHFTRSTETWVGRLDLNSQINRVHGLKSGVEVRYHHLYYKDITPVTEVPFNPLDPVNSYRPQFTIPGSNTLNNTLYNRQPVDAALYIQDKMEYQDFILNVGLRVDYFDPRVQVPADPTDPNINDPQKEDHASDPLNVRQSYWWRKIDPKFQVSPRFALAYPISDAGVIHVSYGHFFQRPSFEVLYTNPYYKWDVNNKYPLIGNPNLNAEKTVSFEIGLQQAISDLLTLDVSLYNRDIRQLVSTDRVVKMTNTSQYVQYVNRDFGYVRGGVLTLDRSFNNYFSFSIAYTLQFAQGNASDRQEALRAIEGNREPEKMLVPLNWDRRHTLNGTFTLDLNGRGGITLLGSFGSGLPYTPEIQSDDVRVGLNENSGRKPIYLNLDLNGYYALLRGAQRLQLTLQVLNLTDRANENNVFGSTGRAGFDLNPHSNDDFWPDPNNWSRPREITVGLEYTF